MQSLVEKSLVCFLNERYWMLETIRDYATERLQEDDDRERLRQRHADHYLALAERVTANGSDALQPVGIRLLADEHDNLRSAGAWFHDARQSDPELRLVCALADFWNIRGHFREARAYIEAALENDALQSPVLRAKTLVEASDFARLGGRTVGQARRFCEESLALFRQLGDDTGVGRALHKLDEAALEEEDYDRAVDLFEKRSPWGVPLDETRQARSEISATPHCFGATMDRQPSYSRKRSHSSANEDTRALYLSLSRTLPTRSSALGSNKKAGFISQSASSSPERLNFWR
jgi:tetratricopeptide (TPR) repeat protein